MSATSTMERLMERLLLCAVKWVTSPLPTSLAPPLAGAASGPAMTESQGVGTRDDKGLRSRYNGVDAHQAHDCDVKLSCEACAQRAPQARGWEEPGWRPRERSSWLCPPVS